MSEIDALQQENARLRKALREYADQRNWECQLRYDTLEEMSWSKFLGPYLVEEGTKGPCFGWSVAEQALSDGE